MMAPSQSEGGTRESTGWGVEPVPWPVWIRSEGIGPAVRFSAGHVPGLLIRPPLEATNPSLPPTLSRGKNMLG